MKTITFLVTWTAVSSIPIPCPDKQKTSKYGSEYDIELVVSCCVLHYREERKERQKEFATEEEADEFIKNMPSNDFGNRGNRFENARKFKITKEELK